MSSIFDFANSFGALLGGIAAALSIWIATKSNSKREEEALIESLRTVALEADDSATKIDMLLSWPLFLDIEENFQKRISVFLSEIRDVDELRSRLDDKMLKVTFPRALTAAIHESKVRRELEAELLMLKKTSVMLKESFPVSGHILLMCQKLLASYTDTLFSTTNVHDVQISGDEDDYFAGLGQRPPQDIVYNLSTLVSDAPMQHIIGEAQPVINEARVIVRILTTSLAQSDFEKLKVQSRHEVSISKSTVNATSTITGDIKAALNGIRKHLKNDDWDALLSAHARLEGSKLLKTDDD